MSYRIFLSYRRLDSEPETGRLFTTLEHELGKNVIFMDTASILLGAEWPERIQTVLTSAATVIVIIGPDWLRAGSDAYGRRPIDKPDDWVRKEVHYALENKKMIIPVLVRGAAAPPGEPLPADIRRLTEKQMIAIRGQYWDHDVKLLILRQLTHTGAITTNEESRFDPYPVPPDVDVALVPAFDGKQLELALRGPLKGWQKLESELPEDKSKTRVELVR